MLIYYLKIVRHTTVSDSTRLKSYSEKRWLSALFRRRGNRRKSRGQNGVRKRTAARMGCRLTLFRMALFSFPYVTCSVAPVGPAGPVAPVAPVAPAAPAGPAGPVAPVAPVGPAGPVAPVAPVAPAAPAGPVAPVAPAGPVCPAGPCAPLGPAGPIDPRSTVTSI